MAKINELNINIKKAIITSVEIKLGDKGLDVQVNGSLLTEQGKTVSSFYFSTSHWEEDRKLELPLELNIPARRIFELLTPEVYKKIQGQFKELPSGKKSKVKTDVIDPDDIPF